MRKLLNERLEMCYHNLMCYSKNLLMTEPKENWEKQWKEAKKEISEIESMLEVIK